MTRESHTVLVVDDEPEVCILLARQLSGLPCTVIPTNSPAEAMHILKTKEIAVLLCDLMMPYIDGSEVLALAREQNPNIVSIAVTGTTDHELTIKAINEGGIWKFVKKPWRRQEIMDLVTQGIERYTALRRQQRQLKELAKDITGKKRAAASSGAKTERIGNVNRMLRAGWLGRTFSPHGERGFGSKRYRLVEVLGEGGMGTVYKADDLLLQMPVAVKILSARFTRDPMAVAALKEEARIAMQLSHRHIVRIHNLQRASGRYFLVMEYVKGRTLREVLDQYKILPIDTVLQIVRVAADALSYAHRHGILHKDLKLTNLMLDEEGVLKIIDFGIAGLMGVQKKDEDVVGTLIYMSPEQLRGESLDVRTDVYSLGVIAYELLMGHNPFPQDTTDTAVIKRGPGALSNLPPHLRPIIQKAMALRPEDRWLSADAFAAALIDAARLNG